MCWASANLDETVFEAADEVRLDRKPNPHVAFGFGEHLCLGAPHARLLLRTVLEAMEKVESEAAYRRTVGYERLVVRLGRL